MSLLIRTNELWKKINLPKFSKRTIQVQYNDCYYYLHLFSKFKTILQIGGNIKSLY